MHGPVLDRPGLLAPQVVVDGRYVLRHKLGRGAFGEVWYAIDLKWSRGTRAYALKFMQPAAAEDRNSFAAVLEEADVLLSLVHENIVMLRNYGTHGQLSWLALDYVAGGSLDALVSQRRASGARGLHATEAGWVLRQLAQAIDFAHKRGVVHRDIKPANILLDTPITGRLERASAIVRLGDFGLALPPDIVGIENPGGTIAYMAPELFTRQGVITKDDLRAVDIYALGATVFAIVAGTPPFGVRGDVARAIVNDPLPPLDSGDEALDAAVRRALSRDPTRRWPTATAFAEAIGEPLTGTAVQVARTWATPADDDAPPVVFVQRVRAYRPEQNASLQVGLVNPRGTNVEGRVFFEPLEPAALVVPTPDRGFALRAGAGDWLQTSIRPGQPGRHRLLVRVSVRAAATGVLHSYEATVYVTVTGNAHDAGEGVAVSGSPSQEHSTVAAGYRELMADAAGCTVRDLLTLPVTGSFPAAGIDAGRDGAPVRGIAAVTVRAGDELLRRIYVRFGTIARFGRVPDTNEGPNEFAWVRQPCRSPQLDPENWALTCRLSRRAGLLRADASGSQLHAMSESIRFDERDLMAGDAVALRTNREHRADMGGIEFALRARRATGHFRDLCRLLVEQPLQSTLASKVMPSTTRHHCIHLRRITNQPEIEYVLACPWVGLGGDPSDDVVVPGLPPDSLLLAHRAGEVFALVGSSLAPRGDWQPRAGMWTPVRDGDSLHYKRFAITVRSTDTATMAADLGREASR